MRVCLGPKGFKRRSPTVAGSANPCPPCTVAGRRATQFETWARRWPRFLPSSPPHYIRAPPPRLLPPHSFIKDLHQSVSSFPSPRWIDSTTAVQERVRSQEFFFLPPCSQRWKGRLTIGKDFAKASLEFFPSVFPSPPWL